MKTTLVAISDTHGLHPYLHLPEGDVLVHAGDISMHGTLAEVAEFNLYLGQLPHPHKVVIAGNHDFCFENMPAEAAAWMTNAIYLQDEAVTLRGLKFYGSPWQPEFCNLAFNLKRGAALREKWALIPPETDVLITHSPPLGEGDLTERGEYTGCRDLREAVERLGPRLHIFGHIHEGAGTTTNGRTTFINASSCDLGYRPVHPPVVIELETE